MVLQVHQLLNKKSRRLCVQENGFQGVLQNPAGDIILSQETLDFYYELVHLRLFDQLTKGKCQIRLKLIDTYWFWLVQKKITIKPYADIDDPYDCDNEGEADKEGNACGYGVAKMSDGSTIKGTWFNNCIHGISK